MPQPTAPRAKAGQATAPLAVSNRIAADTLGVGRDAVYALIEQGKLRTVSIGKRTLVVYADLLCFVEEHATCGLDPEKQAKARQARRAWNPSNASGANTTAKR